MLQANLIFSLRDFLTGLLDNLAILDLSCVLGAPYGSVSAGREKSLFRVTFFLYGEPSCGQTIQNKIDSSIDFG